MKQMLRTLGAHRVHTIAGQRIVQATSGRMKAIYRGVRRQEARAATMSAGIPGAEPAGFFLCVAGANQPKARA